MSRSKLALLCFYNCAIALVGFVTAAQAQDGAYLCKRILQNKNIPRNVCQSTKLYALSPGDTVHCNRGSYNSVYTIVDATNVEEAKVACAEVLNEDIERLCVNYAESAGSLQITAKAWNPKTYNSEKSFGFKGRVDCANPPTFTAANFVRLKSTVGSGLGF